MKTESDKTSDSVDTVYVSYSSAKTIDASVASTITIATIKLKIRSALLMFSLPSRLLTDRCVVIRVFRDKRVVRYPTGDEVGIILVLIERLFIGV